MTQESFFRDRASEARKDADTTELPNVRERCLRSAATWDTMADRERKMTVARARREAEKAVPAASESELPA